MARSFFFTVSGRRRRTPWNPPALPGIAYSQDGVTWSRSPLSEAQRLEADLEIVGALCCRTVSEGPMSPPLKVSAADFVTAGNAYGLWSAEGGVPAEGSPHRDLAVVNGAAQVIKSITALRAAARFDRAASGHSLDGEVEVLAGFGSGAKRSWIFRAVMADSIRSAIDGA